MVGWWDDWKSQGPGIYAGPNEPTAVTHAFDKRMAPNSKPNLCSLVSIKKDQKDQKDH